MPSQGNFAFFPWLNLPNPVLVGALRFVSVDTNNPEPIVGSEISDTAKLIFSRHIDIHGKPIQKCTVALRPRHNRAWDIPERLLPNLFQASECLALIAMAEQRFFEQLSPHINATVFRPIVQSVAPGQESLAISVKRRDRQLWVGGLEFKDVVFQMPLEAYRTECPSPSPCFAKALDKARTSNSTAWTAIRQSLPFFLLGHSETTEIPNETCVLLSALAFERLLDLPQNRRTNANDVSEAFSRLWSKYSTLTVAQARRTVADPHPKHGPSQANWPLHRKWMKELYEARSEQAHGKKKPDRSSNWQPWQHILLAAFVYPMSVKLRLAGEQRYQLTDREMGACRALDKLLDSHWGSGRRHPPEWPRILSMSEGKCELRGIIDKAIRGSVRGGV